ncbi:MAG: hypothetical protein ACE1Z4_06240, partial [Gammaproteobacteria bacterium]
GRQRPVIWVTGPPGSGKTTLIASYIDSKNLRCTWYQIDHGDSDVATFFYYMGLATADQIDAKTKRLPLFTPEYQRDLTTFDTFRPSTSRSSLPLPSYSMATTIFRLNRRFMT